MDKDKILAGVKLIKEAFLTSKEKFAEAKLIDGTTIIRYDGDALAVGTPVNVVTEQGVAPIPDGDYSLEDGTMFNIAGGVVTQVAPADEAAPEGEEKPAEEAAPAAMTEATAKSIIESIVKETHFALEERIKALETEKEKFSKEYNEIETLKANHKTLSENFQKAVELIEMIAGEPSAAPAEGKKPVAKLSKTDIHEMFKATLKKSTKKPN